MRQRLKWACMHIHVRTAGPSAINRPHELLPTPPPSRPENVDGPKGSVWEDEKFF
jgi:hypothetical protein